MNEIPDKSYNAIVLLSGGQDSTVCLFWSKKVFGNILAISYNYGQGNPDELLCAKSICDEFKIVHQVIDIRDFCQSINLDFKRSETDSKHIHGRNLLFLSHVSSIAKLNCIDNIVIGVSQADFNNFPDCREKSIQSINQAVNLAMDFNVKIHTPLMNTSKMETWEMASELGVLDTVLNNTLTCYNNIKAEGCGYCSACKSRLDGLNKYYEGS